jgi:hypothetical protein
MGVWMLVPVLVAIRMLVVMLVIMFMAWGVGIRVSVIRGRGGGAHGSFAKG